MLENTTIARPYARAAFEQAREEGNVSQWSITLKKISMVVSDPQMRRLLNNPKVTHKQLQELVTEVCGGSSSKTEANFIKILVTAKRLKYAPVISRLFEEKRSEAEGRTDIRVTTAYELEPEQEKQVADAMAKRLGKKISVTSIVDSTLIGGMIIRAGDFVIDASLRGRLNQLKNELA